MSVKKYILIAALILICGSASAFGKNKIQYQDFKWFIKESEHFNVYYYFGEEERLLEIIDMLESAYRHHSDFFQFKIKEKTPVILYRTHRDFEQTNIISGFIPPQVGGFAEMLMNRLVVPIDSPYEELKALVWHELTHIFQYHIFRSSLFSRAPPDWFMEGTAEHLSQFWDMKGIMVLRDAVMNNDLYTLQEMENFSYTPDAYKCYKLSQSFTDWFMETFGLETFRKFVRYLKRSSQHSLNDIFKKVLNMSYKQVNDKWFTYLKKKYWPEVAVLEDPDSEYGTPFFFENAPDDIWVQPVFFPSGETLALITTKNANLDIYVTDDSGMKTLKRLTPFYTGLYEYIIVEENSMSISPDGNKLAVFARDGRADVLLVINILSGTVDKYRMGDLLKPRYPDWKDNYSIFFTAENSLGRSIYIFDTAVGETAPVTEGREYCKFVNYDPVSDGLYFTRRTAGLDKIFRLDLSTGSETQITGGPGNDVELNISADGGKIIFTSDRFAGIPNLFIHDLSTGFTSRITNTQGGNFMAQLSPDGRSVAFTSYFKGTYRTFLRKLSEMKQYGTEAEKAFSDLSEKPDYSDVKYLKNVKDYKLKLFPVNVSSYITYENGIIENYSNITLSDILGDIRLVLNIDAVRQFDNFYAYYFTQRHRLNWGVSVFNLRNDYYFWEYQDIGSEGSYGASLFLIYPLSKYKRLEYEIKYGVAYWDDIFRIIYGYPSQKRMFSNTVSFISDSTKAGFFTYNSGSRYMLSFTNSYPLTKSYFSNYSFILDYRAYFRLTMRSSLAFRFFEYNSWGDDKNYIYLGGIGTIRGYYPMSIYGNNAFFSNLEMRIPFIDIIRFSGLFNFYYIRGVMFVDMGSAWLNDDFRAFTKESGELRFDDIRASVGFGIRFQVGYFDLMFDFAKKWDFFKVYPRTYFQFNIGADF